MANLLANTVKSIRIETRWTPAIVIADPFGGSPSAGPGMGAQAGRLLKPKITVETSLGPVKTAPWGEPGPSQWPMIQIGAAAFLIGLAAFFLWKGGR